MSDCMTVYATHGALVLAGYNIQTFVVTKNYQAMILQQQSPTYK